MLTVRPLTALLFLVLYVGPLGFWARAEVGGRRVCVATVPLTTSAQAHAGVVGQVIESAIRRDERSVLLDPSDLFDPVSASERQRKAEAAQEELARGREAFTAVEEGLGASAFDQSAALFEDTPLWMHWDQYTEALSMAVLARWFEDPSSAGAAIDRLIMIAPDVTPPADLLSPDLSQTLTRRREQALRADRVTLDVTSRPVSARVYVDGALMGTTPLTIQGLLPQEHWVSIEAVGYRSQQKRFSARPGGSLSFELREAERAPPYRAALDALVPGIGQPDEIKHARLLGRLCGGASEVLVSAVARSSGTVEVQMHRIAVDDGHVLAAGRLEMDEGTWGDPVKVDALTRDLLAKDRLRGPEGQPLGFHSQWGSAVARARTVARDTGPQILGWTALGLGLVSTGLGLRAWSDARGIQGLPQTSPDVQTLVSAGRSSALGADITGAASVALGAAWAWLRFGRDILQRMTFESGPTEITHDPVPRRAGEESDSSDRGSVPARGARDDEDSF